MAEREPRNPDDTPVGAPHVDEAPTGEQPAVHVDEPTPAGAEPLPPLGDPEPAEPAGATAASRVGAAAPQAVVEDRPRRGGSRMEQLRVIGGLVAVLTGLGVVLLIGLATILLLAFRDVSDVSALVAVATAAFGVVSAVVGAFFGLKLGTDQARESMRAHEAAEAKASMFALHVPADQADVAGRDATRAWLEARREPPT